MPDEQNDTEQPEIAISTNNQFNDLNQTTPLAGGDNTPSTSVTPWSTREPSAGSDVPSTLPISPDEALPVAETTAGLTVDVSVKTAQAADEAAESFTPFAPTPVDIQNSNQDSTTTTQSITQPYTPAQAVTPNPTVMTPGQTPGSSGSDPLVWWKSKKLIIGALIAIVSLAVIGTSTFAYVAYQDPKKVVDDSIINAVVAKQAIYAGKLDYSFTSKSDYGDDKKIKATLEINSKLADAGQQSHNAKLNITYQDKSYAVEGDALFDKVGDMYFKVNGLKGLAEAKDSFGFTDPAVSAAIDKFISRVDNTWIRVSTDDLKDINPSYSATKKCINETIDKFRDDKKAIQEVANLYRENAYIVVKEDLGVVDGNFTYKVAGDTKAGKAFIIGLKNTKIYNSLHECDNSFEIDEDAINELGGDQGNDPDSKEESSYKLSVNMWNHQIVKFESDNKVTTNSGDSSSAMSAKTLITPNYSQNVNIEAPSKSINLSQLKSYFEELSQAIDNYYSSKYNY